ncbi:carboxynorspermidine decarboxylase [Pseudobutyrivibrio sp. 49]|uniref:carboxynorspermidine decarboxylase n=1 Tax=unclassified Pseudobutyrivibrio TaxID=2638619 RepID=UPI00087E0720|nr:MULTISPECIES: carboxynorspermidine decarboxylase [unclassified Pseudobutyrivibrio]SDH70275.1 carboxynorspermidine decarboxylase [Pseudobutyrivibrio sp. 49]SFN73231.1 carboxynorspermidine decarboxylase [Pseudobutyrivibrio sp. UC1225]
MILSQVETPSYVIDEGKLIENLKVLERVQQEAGCKILLAQKAFSNFCVYPLIGKYLAGTTASGLYEARLGKEEMGKENHVFAPAYKEADMDELVKLCDHIIFNSVAQLMKYKDKCLDAGVSIGLRINPECSTQGDQAIYDPCSKGSRLGVTLTNLQQAIDNNPDVLKGVDGLHFHTLCEQNSDDLETTIEVVKDKFGQYLDKMSWINMGGGHHISREDYDINRLVRIIKDVKETYNLEVYLEPGEAIALNAGYLVTEVLDIVDNGIKTLILDASAACHMPDVLEMPYRPPLKDSGEWGQKPYEYRLSSYTCLAGDIIGDYSFDNEIMVGDRLVFEDMAIYSMVKNNTFNGIPLPSIYLQKQDGDCQLVKKFGYEDFKNRLS